MVRASSRRIGDALARMRLEEALSMLLRSVGARIQRWTMLIRLPPSRHLVDAEAVSLPQALSSNFRSRFGMRADSEVSSVF
jgi:hypothetical protein